MLIHDLSIDGEKFFINNQPTYKGRSWDGHSLEGRLFNSRMVQAIFDDECPETAVHWKYPDTGSWDPQRNTDEFCAMLKTYHEHGLMAVTVGLQGGGSIYSDDIYQKYKNTAIGPDGELKAAYKQRLKQVIAAADAAGMVVIVNYFYVQQVKFIPEDAAIRKATADITEWLLGTGYHNIIIDLANEIASWWKRPIFEPARIHELMDIVNQTRADGRKLLCGCSLGGDKVLTDEMIKASDFLLPHGNCHTPEQVRKLTEILKDMAEFKKNPMPIVFNEDSTSVNNLIAALECGVSWGLYYQGYGSGYSDAMQDWTVHGREKEFDKLSGFQTMPVNWGINTVRKKIFFDALKEITGGL